MSEVRGERTGSRRRSAGVDGMVGPFGLDPIFVFSLAFALFFIGPPLLGFPFPLYSLMKTGDAFDLLTPLVLIPLYGRLWQEAGRKPVTPKESAAFLVLAGLWVLGQGMHLAANSIGHLLASGSGDAYALTHFYDEVLSHYLWHLGIFGLTGMILLRASASQETRLRSASWTRYVAALLYGLTYFIIVVEARTWPIGVPFALLVVVWQGRALLGRRQPPEVVWFFGWAHLLALVLFAGWGLYWGRLPEFSELGWI